MLYEALVPEIVAAGDDDAIGRERVDHDDLVVDDGEPGLQQFPAPARRNALVAQRHGGDHAGIPVTFGAFCPLTFFGGVMPCSW